MPLDLSLELVGLIVLGGLAVLCALAVVCSGASEELEMGLATVLPEPAGDVFEPSDEEVDAEFWRIAAAQPLIPHPRSGSDDPYDVEKEGL